MIDLKSKLKNKEVTFGSWLSFAYLPIVEIMAKQFDWLVIDMEHTCTDFERAFQMIQVTDLAGSLPLVRVGKNDELLIKRVMDSGAAGVLVPMVNTKEEAEAAVAYTKYPPKGKRGVGLFRAQKYGQGFPEYKQWVEEKSVVIVQIEHIKAVENLDEILSVEGVDGFIVGPYDLSGSIGHPGNFEHPLMLEALNVLSDKIRNHPKPGGYHIVHPTEAIVKQKLDEGYKFIAYGVDEIFFTERLKQENEILKKFGA